MKSKVAMIKTITYSDIDMVAFARCKSPRELALYCAAHGIVPEITYSDTEAEIEGS